MKLPSPAPPPLAIVCGSLCGLICAPTTAGSLAPDGQWPDALFKLVLRPAKAQAAACSHNTFRTVVFWDSSLPSEPIAEVFKLRFFVKNKSRYQPMSINPWYFHLA